MRRFPIFLSCLILALALPIALVPADAATFEVAVSSNIFNPSVLNIEVGDTVTWTNQSGSHNVLADDSSFGNGAASSDPWIYSFTFTEVGNFQYYCTVHGGPGSSGMSGLINVTGGGTGNAGSIRFASSAFSVNEASGTANVQLQRVGGDNGAVSALVTTSDGTAAADEDYLDISTVVNWADNDDDPKSVTVSIINDSNDEPNETVFLNLSNPTGGAALGTPSTAVLTIIDDDDGSPTNCVENATTLCLLENRFQVRATFATNQGNSGQARAIELTPDTGYFWFFNQDNVELVVKVRNACVNPFNRFWFFAGGLTNVQVDITVTDTANGAVKTYRNPQTTPFQPITDTDAFATCP